jgi:AcrR family transcriptional regulator
MEATALVQARKSSSKDSRRLKKEALLRSAAEALSSRGLRQTTMDDIALAAGTSKVVLYRYFASKEDLIHSILERVTDRLLVNERQPFAGIGSGFREAIHIAREDEPSFLLLMQHCAADPEFGGYVARIRTAIVEENIKRFAVDVAMAPYDALFRRLCAEAIATFCLDALTRWTVTGSPAADAHFTDWAVESLKGLYKGWVRDAAARR